MRLMSWVCPAHRGHRAGPGLMLSMMPERVFGLHGTDIIVQAEKRDADIPASACWE
jgi:hypothetical protein